MESSLYIRFHHAGDVTVKAGNLLGPRRIRDYELVYFPRGGGTVYISERDGECRLDQSCVLITRPNEWHEYRFDPDSPTRHLYVHFDLVNADALKRYPLLGGGADCSVVFLREYSLIPQFMKQMAYYFYWKPSRWRQMSELLMLSVFEEMESAGGPNPPPPLQNPSVPAPVIAALRFIEDNIGNPIDVRTLAAVSGWSHEHFARTFQRHVGYSPKEWINKRKIERAAQLLLQRTDSVKEIAREVGFADEYYFYRLFRRWMGMTSAQYRMRYGDPRLRELAPADDWSRFYPTNHSFVLDMPAFFE